MFGDSEYTIHGDATIVLRATAPTREAALEAWRGHQAVTIDHTHVRDGRAVILAELSTHPAHAHVAEINGVPQVGTAHARITLDHSSTDSIAAGVAQLDPAIQQRIADALRNAAAARADTAFLTHLHKTIAAEFTTDDREHADVIGVLFLTAEWDNGYLLATTGEVLLADGGTVDIDFGDTSEKYFGAAFGARGATFGLAIDLRTNDINPDLYHAKKSIHAIFGIPEPETPADYVRAVLDQHLTPSEKAAATGVLFLAREHHGAYALTDTGEVLFLDGTIRELTFPGITTKHLHTAKPRPDKFGTVINLMTTKTEPDRHFDTLLDHTH
ncbi:hypothetical protein [Nocardia sp. NRRL S-836]|uniref:hypothetical protein n=1 Tax=Nocardia sp. NRRL S-836 TaxID=1519492 RepID=UPI0006AEE1E2|nr:hypothetical protein [Nocardia sp. NRRL S-836]KOV84778.1 hypothetical protein ADL03_16065 [Nocardia sp. NRRL S-836]